MSAVFADIDISMDGYIAGPRVSRDNPLGDGGERLVWYGDDVNQADADLAGAYAAADAQVLARAAEREGAVIMGRRTFEVSIEEWAEEPPIGKACFVLSRLARPPLRRGRTTFTFVEDAPTALRHARDAAGDRDVGVMGGAETIRSFLAEGLLDELHLHLIPVLLGGGIRLFREGGPEALDRLDLQKVEVIDGARATHLRYRIAAIER